MNYISQEKNTYHGTETSVELNFTTSKYNNTLYLMRAALYYFASYKAMYQVIFSTQGIELKAIAIEIVKDNPLVEIGWLLWYVHLSTGVLLTYKPTK